MRYPQLMAYNGLPSGARARIVISGLSRIVAFPARGYPAFVQANYQIEEVRHATAILRHDFPGEWDDIVEILAEFRLYRSHIVAPGGRKSRISSAIDSEFHARGWQEKSFKTKVLVDHEEMDSPTHKIDCYKNRIALEVESNNKDPFYDRDLNNFRVLFELRAVSVGIVITRCDELQDLFNDLGKGTSYGASTTHMGKLLPRIDGGGGGGCPIFAIGIRSSLYVED